jgi:hypothetical protein
MPPPAAGLPPGLERLGRFMDEAIRLPGGFRIGWDAVIGLIPGIGDAVGAAVSAYIVLGAARAGVSGIVLLRMIGNVALETIVGTIPLVGDLFDAAYKANMRNLRLLERHSAAPRTVHRRSVGVVIGVLAVLLGAVVAIGFGVAWAVGRAAEYWAA